MGIQKFFRFFFFGLFFFFFLELWHPTPVLLPGKSMDGGVW